MARILGLDFGTKKCGLATTDPLQIIVSAIGTVATTDLIGYLKNYILTEEVEEIVVGVPTHRDGEDTYLRQHIDLFVTRFRALAPDVKVSYQDERMTSVEAKSIILQSGIGKTKRRDKTLVDKVSAVLILQKYLHHI